MKEGQEKEKFTVLLWPLYLRRTNPNPNLLWTKKLVDWFEMMTVRADFVLGEITIFFALFTVSTDHKSDSLSIRTFVSISISLFRINTIEKSYFCEWRGESGDFEEWWGWTLIWCALTRTGVRYVLVCSLPTIRTARESIIELESNDVATLSWTNIMVPPFQISWFSCKKI